jgi:HSP20 family protein
MAMVHWSPIREIEALQREMNQLFDVLSPATPIRPNGSAFVPAAELSETPDAIHLKLEVPGIEAKDLDIQVTAEAVAISGERQAAAHSESEGVMRSEFRYGKFQRVIPLSTRVQNDKVEANYTNGILTLRLPKVDAEKHRVVKVNLG